MTTLDEELKQVELKKQLNKQLQERIIELKTKDVSQIRIAQILDVDKSVVTSIKKWNRNINISKAREYLDKLKAN